MSSRDRANAGMRASNIANSLGVNDPRIRRGMQLPEALKLGEGLRIDEKGRIALDLSAISVEGTREILKQIDSVVRIDRAITIDKTITQENEFEDDHLLAADIVLGDGIGANFDSISDILGQLLLLASQADLGLLAGRVVTLEGYHAEDTEVEETWVDATVSVNDHLFYCDSSAQFRYATPSVLGSYTFSLPEGTSRITQVFITFERGVITEHSLSDDDSDMYVLWFPMWKTSSDLKIYNTTPGYRTILPEQVAWANDDPYATWYAHPRLGEAIMFFYDEEDQVFHYKDEHIAIGPLNVLTTGTYGLHKVDLVGATTAQTSAGEGGEHFRVNGTFKIRYACI